MTLNKNPTGCSTLSEVGSSLACPGIPESALATCLFVLPGADASYCQPGRRIPRELIHINLPASNLFAARAKVRIEAAQVACPT